MATASPAMRTCSAPRSASENTATVAMSCSRQARITRQAISPRLAIRTLRMRRAGMRSVSRRCARAARFCGGLQPAVGAHDGVGDADARDLAELLSALLQPLAHVYDDVGLD